MKSQTSKKKVVKKIKGWIHIKANKYNFTSWPALLNYKPYKSIYKEEIEYVPCTITYVLPTYNKKKKTKIVK